MNAGLQIIAHRGASSIQPENTLSAIQHAISLGVDFVEIDVHLAEDGVPVVIHDQTLCRTTNAEKGIKIRETPSHYIKKYDAGSWFHGVSTSEKVPTLDEVLALDFGNTGLMVEIKDDVNHDLSSAAFSVLEKCALKKICIGSFSAQAITYFHKKFPQYDLIGIVEDLAHLQHFDQVELQHLAVAENLLQKEAIDSLLRKHPSIWAYTVDDPKRAVELQSHGIVGIITNNPEIYAVHKR